MYKHIHLFVCVIFVTRSVCASSGDFSCGALPKNAWGGMNPTHVEYLARPVALVIIQHTATDECNTTSACEEIVRNIQRVHIVDREWWDMGPSFLIGGDGRVYEGAGWTRVGAHTYGYNRISIGISFIGDFSKKLPTPEAIAAGKNLIQCGVEKQHLTPDYRLVGHRQLIALESPGYAFYEKIKSWPHWTSDVSQIKKN